MTTPASPDPPIHHAAASVLPDGGAATSSVPADAAALLAPCGLLLRADDAWQEDELRMVLRAVADLLDAAGWSPGAFARALGGAITLTRDRDHPIVTDATGTRRPILGLYDAGQRTLTVNNWSFDARTGGEEGGRRVLLHELAHAWDGRSRYRLSWWLQWYPGTRASDYARASRFEDWSEAVMGTVYGAEPGHEAFDRPHSPRRCYVRRAFRRYRQGR